jgi:hypothetical protein
MKKTYIQPTTHTYPITPTTLLTISDGLNLSKPEEGDAADAASRSFDDDEWGDE